MWQLGLEDVVKHPERHAGEIVSQSDAVIVIRDKYPKARFHYLVLPKAGVRSLSDLNSEHVPMLEAMQVAAADIIQRT